MIDPQDRPELSVSDEEVTAFVALHATRAIQRQYGEGDEPASIAVQFQGETVQAYEPEYFGNDMIVVTVVPGSDRPEYIFALMRTEQDAARWETVGHVLVDMDADSMYVSKTDDARHLAKVVGMLLA
jgi:hypothetical protein